MIASKIDPETVAKMLDGVTPGPWKCCETTIHGRKYGGCWVEGPDVDDGDGRPHGLLIPISGSGGAKSFTTRLVDIQGHDHNDANARFIAWAREAVPALAARVAELEKYEAGWAEAEGRLTDAEAKLAARDAEVARREQAAYVEGLANSIAMVREMRATDGLLTGQGLIVAGLEINLAKARAALQEKQP